MTRKHKGPGEKQWRDARSIEKSGLDGIVSVSSFAPVAEPPVKAHERPNTKPSYEPDSNPKPAYQPETSGNRDVPPSEPPVRKGLSGWQKFGLGAGIAAVALVGYFGINALRNQQIVPISTPTPAPSLPFEVAPLLWLPMPSA